MAVKSFMYEATDIPEGVKMDVYHNVKRHNQWKKRHIVKNQVHNIRRSAHKGIDNK